MSNDAKLHVLHRNPLQIHLTSLNLKYVCLIVCIYYNCTSLQVLLLGIDKHAVPYLHTNVVRKLSIIASCLHTIYFSKYQQ